MENSNESQASNLRQKAEQLVNNKLSKSSLMQNYSEKLKLIHEIEVHQIELRMQNEELILTKENLEIAVEKYTALYDFAPSGYFTLTPEGKILDLNLSAATMLSKERHYLINNLFELFVTTETKQIFNIFLISLFKSKTNKSCEVTLLADRNYPLYVYLIGQQSKNGNECYISMIDITERKQAEGKLQNLLNQLTIANKKIEFQIEEKKVREKELVIANIELEQALHLNADKNRLISILAHDLRSPFSVLLGYSELLLEKIHHLDINEIEKLVKEIQESTQNTFTLLEDLLKWARLQSGKIPFKPQKMNFADGCKDIIKILTPASNAKNITVSCSVAEDIEVLADVDMLKAVLRNLISNAIKYTNTNGKVIVTAEHTDSNLIFSVSNNGTGIEARDLTKLFDLAQLHITPGTAGEKGTGLGLFLCKGFVEKHGGKIWAESRTGKGSIFYFNIPCITKSPEKTIPSDSEDQNKIKKLKILIADDNNSLRIILGEMVKKYSKEILYANSGVEAVSYMRKNPDIDLILMDFYMPEMNGYEASKQIRLINKEAVIIVETADTLSNITEEFAGSGINDYFPKPYNKIYLNQLIIKHFSNLSTT